MPDRFGTCPGQKNKLGNRNSEPKHAKAIQNHEKLRNLQKHEKHQETIGFINFSTFKINFRSADAANHVNRDARQIPGVTRRAYIPKI